MADDPEDAKYEEWRDNMFIQFREERGAEIADELDFVELITPILAAHKVAWPGVESVLRKAQVRLGDGEHEEAIFHACRALDGYVRSVLVEPIRGVISDRIVRAVPTGLIANPNQLVASARALESGMPFAIYGVALLAKNITESEAMGTRISDFIRGSGGGARWDLRNRLFHSAISATAGAAAAIVAEVDAILSWLKDAIDQRESQRLAELEREEFAPERTEPLTFLAQLRELDKTAGSPLYKIYVNNSRASMRLWQGLRSLETSGYIERAKEPIFGEVFRLTDAGERYYDERVRTRVKTHTNDVARSFATHLPEWRRDIIAERGQSNTTP